MTMAKKTIVIIILLISVFILGGYKLFTTQNRGLGGLKVISSPETNIFLDDKLIGKTPYDDKQVTGEHVLKLIPEDTATQSASWQGKISIYPSVLTYVNRELGISEYTSAGEILTLEKNPQNEVQLSVNATPDGSVVLIDGQERGTTPFFINNIIPGEHDVSVVSPGFISRTIRVQTTIGYKLIVDFQLALSGNSEKPLGEIVASPSGELKPTVTETTPMVKIKDTPTGFLRVRSSPNTSATESAQVKPGDKFPLIDEKEGWYKITYESGKEGWISSRYAEKLNK